MAYMTMEEVALAGRAPKVGVGALIGASFRSLKANLPSIWGGAVALAGVQAAMSLGAGLLGVDLLRPKIDAALLVFLIASAIPTAVIAAGVVRTVLGRTEDAWGMDGDALAFVGLNVLMMGAGAAMLAVLAPPAEASNPAMMAYGVKVLGMGLLAMVAAYVSVRLALWPVGVLMGEPDLSFGDAWTGMKGAFFAYLIASFVMGLAPGFAGGLVNGLFAAHPNAAATAVARGLSSLSGLGGMVVLAELYRLRVGDRGRFAEVFD